ncbi:MAG: C25 family cysteine peptidase [Promethearchaeota archaeon]
MKYKKLLILVSLTILITTFSLTIPSNQEIKKFDFESLASSNLNDGDVEYLIITTNEFKPRLSSLVLWKSQKGLNARIETVEDIEILYSGYDTSAKIKACIDDYHSNNNTEFVLLAGDHQHIPSRMAYVDEGYTWGGDGDYVACDSYYANLNNWDTDGDNIYAEDADDWSLTADVYVGRLSANDASEMQMLVNRIISYETNPPVGEWMNRALFAGAMTYFEGDNYAPGDGISDYPEADSNRFFNYIYDRFYDDWTVTLLAEDGGIPEGRSDHPHNASLTAGSLEAEIMNGASILGVYGHGNAVGISRTIWDTDYDGDGLFDWNGEMASHYDESTSIRMIHTNTSEYSMTDNMFSVCYLMGCSNGNFTTLGVDSLAEYMLKTVSIGSIGGDRVIWGEDNWTERSFGGWYDEGLAYRFYEQLDSYDQPGKAFALAKQDYQEDRVTYGYNEWIPEPRWCEKIQKQFNYFGDPELHIWMAIPEILNATWVEKNNTATIVDIFTEVSGSIESAIVTLTNGSNNVIWEGYTNSSGQVIIPQPFHTVNESVIVASKPTYIPYISKPYNFPSPYAPILTEISPRVDQDGIIELNWTPISGSISYNIYRDNSEIFDVMDIEPIHSTINSEYTDQGLQDGVYYYVITAVSATGESIPSNCCFVTVVKPTIPGYSMAILSILGLICLVVVVKVNKNKMHKYI